MSIDSEWDSIIKASISAIGRKYDANNIVLFQGEVPPLVLFIKKGYIVSYTVNSHGDEQIISFYTSGDIIPIEWAFQRSPVSLYYYRTLTQCEILPLSRDELQNQINTNPDLTRKLLMQFANNFIGSTVHIHALEHSYSQDKIIKVLHYLALRFGTEDSNKSGVFKMPFKLTHAQLASMIGIARETVSIEAVKLKKKGAIKYDNGIYTIYLAKLIKNLGSEEFDTLEIQSTA